MAPLIVPWCPWCLLPVYASAWQSKRVFRKRLLLLSSLDSRSQLWQGLKRRERRKHIPSCPHTTTSASQTQELIFFELVGSLSTKQWTASLHNTCWICFESNEPPGPFRPSDASHLDVPRGQFKGCFSFFERPSAEAFLCPKICFSAFQKKGEMYLSCNWIVTVRVCHFNRAVGSWRESIECYLLRWTMWIQFALIPSSTYKHTLYIYIYIYIYIISGSSHCEISLWFMDNFFCLEFWRFWPLLHKRAELKYNRMLSKTFLVETHFIILELINTVKELKFSDKNTDDS